MDSFARVMRMAREAQTSVGVGRPPTEEDLRSLDNLTFVDFARKIGIPPTSLPAFALTILNLQRKDPSLPAVFPGMSEVLEETSRRCPVAVITASITAEVRRILQTHGLSDCISLILDGRDPRPKSEKLRDALQRFNASTRETYMIGDARSDIQQGKLAGVRTIAVTWGYQPREALVAEAPDFVVDSPPELLQILSLPPPTETRGDP